MKTIFKKVPWLMLTLGLAGCSTFNTYLAESRSLDHQIVIDGKSDDWRGDLYVVEGERISAGFLNDGENLYVCLLIADNSTRTQIMMRGLTVWFDPQGGKKKAFGIKFPLGMPRGDKPKLKMGEEGPELENPPEGPLAELEIVRPDKESAQKMNVADAKGIEVKAVPSTGLLVYELKIPLVKTEKNPWAVGAEPGQTIGVGFEAEKIDTEKMLRGQAGGRPGGGGGGMPPMGGGTGRGGRGGFGRGPQMSEPLKIWAIVKLSQGPSTRQPEVLFLSR